MAELALRFSSARDSRPPLGRPLRVLVSGLSASLGGGGSYLSNQVAALAQVPGLELRILASAWLADRLAVGTPGLDVVRQPTVGTVRRVLWEQMRLRAAAADHDVLYMPGNFALLHSPTPQVLALQNAWYFADEARTLRRRLPSHRRRGRLAAEAALSRRSVRHAEAVICVSEAMRAMIEGEIGRQPHLRVVRPAPPSVVPRRRNPTATDPYVLAVGHDDPHKHWDQMIELFSTEPSLPRLQVVGSSERWGATGRRHRSAKANSARVGFLGPIDDPEVLGRVYAGAACLLAPARFESFGLTPAEGLAYALPVAVSDIPAHREVCGQAAEYFAPGDGQEMAAAIKRCLDRGASRAPSPLAKRTWSDNAAELADVLWQAAARPGG